jgi:hypothetical protein
MAKARTTPWLQGGLSDATRVEAIEAETLEITEVSASGQVPTHNGLTAVDDSGCSESLPFLDRGAAKQHGGSLARNANGSALFVLVPCNDAAHDGPSQYVR